MRNRWTPFLLSLLVVLADRWSKIAIEHSMTSLDSVSLIPGWLRIIHTENAGAAFGILAEGNRWLRSGILIGVSGVVLVFVISALWTNRASFTATLARISLALILGGALGNLYDRVIRGTVTDFIEVYHGGWSFPAFNVADSAITVGAILLLFELLRQPSHTNAPGSEPTANPSGLAHNK
ncbi:MAG TPA: signal peptidase II [Bryobacteraceae bacterium]|jgi:signal peptidase II|nr:signal peptidase II [Bryobacteraceae bacterium]